MTRLTAEEIEVLKPPKSEAAERELQARSFLSLS